MASTVLWVSGLIIGLAICLIGLIRWLETASLHMQKPRTSDAGSGSASGAYGDSGLSSCADGGSAGGGDGC